MKQLKAQTSGWSFILEPEARWLAVECILMATRLQLNFHKLFWGALGDELVSWQKKNENSLSLLRRAGYQGMTVALDECRIGYLAARTDWAKIHNNELIPLGRALEHMITGSSQKAAINKAIRSYQKIRVDIKGGRNSKNVDIPDFLEWPDGYKFLSVDSFQKRFKYYRCVLPYAYIYYRNRDYNAWAGLIPDEQNPIILPDDFTVWNERMWKQLQDTRRIRFRHPDVPISIKFQ